MRRNETVTKLHYFVGACVALNLGLSHAVETAGDQATPEAPAVKAVTPPTVYPGAAQRIYRDPVTGEFTTPPPGFVEEIPPQFQQTPGANTSDQGLEVVTHPDGSQSVDLQGRFQSTVFATIDPDGRIDVSHQPAGAGSTASAPLHDQAVGR